MGTCSYCGADESMPFTCKFCRETYCAEHHLPENHDCIGLEKFKEHRAKNPESLIYEPFQERRKKEPTEKRARPMGLRAHESLTNLNTEKILYLILVIIVAVLALEVVKGL